MAGIRDMLDTPVDGPNGKKCHDTQDFDGVSTACVSMEKVGLYKQQLLQG